MTNVPPAESSAVITPQILLEQLSQSDLVIVDVSQHSLYQQQHIIGAIHLPYDALVEKTPPIMGKLPSIQALTNALSKVGLTAGHTIVAYDNEGGANAARFLWVLDILGHQKKVLLSGGFQAWKAINGGIEQVTNTLPESNYQPAWNTEPIADKDYILDHLTKDNFLLLDARTIEEYRGEKVFSKRGGHIPGAVHFEWVNANDPQNFGHVKEFGKLKQQLHELGVTSEKEIVCYCQTNRRSAYMYWILKALGFPKVKAYPGSWSEWGNCLDVPVE